MNQINQQLEQERKVIWIYTTVDGVPDILFEREGIPKVDSYQPHYMRRYSPSSLSEAFRAMGCQQPLSGAMADWMFQFLRKCPINQLSLILGNGANNLFINQRTYSKPGQFIILTRMQFHRLACTSLHVHQFRKIRYCVDFRLALDFMEDRRFFILLLSGAPGTGKSTMASLIASRMAVNHILSTDSIRHAMRTFYPQDKYPILYKSTYECGDVVDPEHKLSEKDRCIKGYLEQSDLVGTQLTTIVSSFVSSHASLIVEGVHLSVSVMLKIVQQFPNVVPFLVYIKKEDFHRQRFAVRAKYMTTDPSQNRYISNFDAIRCVQQYLSEGASQHLLPKIDNRNIDRSLETMHQTVFSYLKKLEGRKSMYDESTHKLTFLDTVWKRRKQKMTSKSKSLKAIKNMKKASSEDTLNNCTESKEMFFSELLEALPVEGKKVTYEDMDGNVIQYLRNGSMLMSFDENQLKKKSENDGDDVNSTNNNNDKAQQEEEVVPIPKQFVQSSECQDQDFPDTETDLDPAEVTLTDFVETTDSEVVDWKAIIANNLRRSPL